MISSSQKIKYFELNVNSSRSKHKQHYLLDFIAEHEPDKMLLVETNLKKHQKLLINNYNIVRNDRAIKEGGGTAVMLRNNYKFEHIQYNNTFNSFEQTTIKLHLNNNNYLYFTSLYKAPNKNINVNELSKLIDSFNNTPYIIGGDFNAIHTYWGNTSNKAEGNKLYKWFTDTIDKHKLSAPKTDGPTCIRANSESYVDIYFVEEGLSIAHSTAAQTLKTYDFDSDHRSVALEIIINNKVISSEPI